MTVSLSEGHIWWPNLKGFLADLFLGFENLYLVMQNLDSPNQIEWGILNTEDLYTNIKSYLPVFLNEKFSNMWQWSIFNPRWILTYCQTCPKSTLITYGTRRNFKPLKSNFYTNVTDEQCSQQGEIRIITNIQVYYDPKSNPIFWVPLYPSKGDPESDGPK